MPEPRRFPPPWRAEPITGGYVVRDATGQALAYLYGRADPPARAPCRQSLSDEIDATGVTNGTLPVIARSPLPRIPAPMATIFSPTKNH
jgi:hypothetical protein